MYLGYFPIPYPGDQHVKFATGTHLEPQHIEVVDSGELPEAHIGILRNHHTYKAEIPIPHSLGTNIVAEHPQHNIYVRVLDVSSTRELDVAQNNGNRYCTMVNVKVKTIKDGSIAEQIILSSEEDQSQSKVVVVSAKVLLTRQGNPLLKDGVHLISHEHTDDSDFTEWPGHGKDVED